MTHYETDEFEDVVVSLKVLRDALEQLPSDTDYWKPAIFFAHAALQGACVCLLTRTDGTGALAVNSEKALMKKLYGETEDCRTLDDPETDWPVELIASLPELLKRLPEALSVELPGHKAKTYGWDVKGDLRRLHEFRNQLAHFPPTSWSLEIIGLPRILRSAVELARGIMTSSGYTRYNKFHDLGESVPLADKCLDLLNEIERSLASEPFEPDTKEA